MIPVVQSTCLLPHRAKTHDPKRLPSEGAAAEALFRPLSASHGVVSWRDTPRHSEHEARHQLCWWQRDKAMLDPDIYTLVLILVG